MNLDFAARERRLRNEQEERLKRAREKADRDRRAREEVERAKEAREAEAAARRLEAIAEAERAEAEREEERAANRGVLWRAALEAVPYNDDEVRERGIRRYANKVRLPPSCGADMIAQDAAGKNGAQFFEITNRRLGTRTVVGVLDFEAREGTVALPTAACRALFPPPEDASAVGAEEPEEARRRCEGVLDVRYVTIPMGTWASLQPRTRGFQKSVEDIKGSLELALLPYSCLTVGDTVYVKGAEGERPLELKVVGLQPASSVSLVETELEITFMPSAEQEEEERREKEREEHARRLMEDLRRSREEQEERARAAEESWEDFRRSRAEALGPEPAPGSAPDLLTIQVRLPEGGRVSRRFLPESTVRDLFGFVDSVLRPPAAWTRGEGPPGVGGTATRSGAAFVLVAQYPRRVVERKHEAETLRGAGLRGAETLMVEREHID